MILHSESYGIAIKEKKKDISKALKYQAICNLNSSRGRIPGEANWSSGLWGTSWINAEK